MFTSAAVSHICCIYMDSVAWACPVTALKELRPTLQIHCSITRHHPWPHSINGFSEFQKAYQLWRSIITQQEAQKKSGLMWVGNRLSEDRWGHTLSACQDLPFPVRLKLPPSQSASVLQSCLPGSCYKQDTGVSLCTQVRKEDMKKKAGRQPGNVKETSCF